VKENARRRGEDPGRGIDVTAADGKVTLWGTAATRLNASARRASPQVDGVRSVDNQIKVREGLVTEFR